MKVESTHYFAVLKKRFLKTMLNFQNFIFTTHQLYWIALSCSYGHTLNLPGRYLESVRSLTGWCNTVKLHMWRITGASHCANMSQIVLHLTCSNHCPHVLYKWHNTGNITSCVLSITCLLNVASFICLHFTHRTVQLQYADKCDILVKQVWKPQHVLWVLSRFSAHKCSNIKRYSSTTHCPPMA